MQENPVKTLSVNTVHVLTFISSGLVDGDVIVNK